MVIAHWNAASRASVGSLGGITLYLILSLRRQRSNASSTGKTELSRQKHHSTACFHFTIPAPFLLVKDGRQEHSFNNREHHQ
jgi:hypothetical protein